MKIKKSVLGVALLPVIVLVIAYQSGKPRRPADATVPSDPPATKVTFIELGSVTASPAVQCSR